MEPIHRQKEHLRDGAKELERLLGGEKVGEMNRGRGGQGRRMQTLGEAWHGWKEVALSFTAGGQAPRTDRHVRKQIVGRE